MRVTEFIIEAAYDSMLDALVRKYPDHEQDIRWGKNLKKQDRVVWYLNILKQYLQNPNDNKPLGGEKNLGQFQEKLTHYLGQNIPKIDAVVFKNEINAQDLFNQFAQIEQEHQSKQRSEAPPAIQTGDYKLIPFSNGTAWWYINRAYCSDEARSGGHCGNVVGQHKEDQRILSYRDTGGHVLLTFILEPNGTLGEMKARFNRKPDPKYHPYIMQLLLNNIIKGITGKGYLPDMNFSIFDLDEKNLDLIDKNKPKLIRDQLKITPSEILKAPRDIQQKYSNYVSKDVQLLLDNPSIETWEQVLKHNSQYILYAPNELPNYRKKLLTLLKYNPINLLKARNEWRNDFELLSDLVSYNGKLAPINIKYITPNTKNYDKLALKAVQQFGQALGYVPEELRTPELCLAAVQQNGYALEYVPKKVLTPELCLAAVKQDGRALSAVPEELRTPKLCLAAIKQNPDALRYVPKDLKRIIIDKFTQEQTTNEDLDRYKRLAGIQLL